MLTIRRRPYFIRLIREVFYACARPMQKAYWWLFRPYRPGAKTFIFYQNKLLLVRIGYAHKKWVLPGGGIEQGEESGETAIRETREESGLIITNTVYIGERSYNNQYKKITVFYYLASVLNDDLVIDGQEIIDAAWFSIDSLPKEIPSRLLEEIVMYNEWKRKQLI